MEKFLEELQKKPEMRFNRVRFCVYNNRIQKRIEKELDQLLYLCTKHPEIFLDEQNDINKKTGTIVSHRRLKKLLLCLKALNRNMDVELVLKEVRENKVG